MVGLILKASYQLNRHHMGLLRLNTVPLVLALVSGLIWRMGRLAGGRAALITVLCLISFLVTLLAKRRGFIVFRQGEVELTPSSDCRELAPDEKVAVRATGLFEVRGNRRYFVEVAADFATMETREHIMMAKIVSSRFLLGAPKGDVAWWYIFIKPHTAMEITVGQLLFGLRARPAIRLGYKTDEGEVEPVYLSFDEPLQLRRVLQDLHRDAGIEPDSLQQPA